MAEAKKYKVEITWMKRSPVTQRGFECEKVVYANTGNMVMFFKKEKDDVPFFFVSNFQSVEVHEVKE